MAKQFKCSNYGVCPEADKETIFLESDLEEVDGKYVCPKCGQELEVLEKGGGGNGKLIGIIAGAVVVLGAGAFLIFGGEKDKPAAEPVAEVVEQVLEEPQEEIVEEEVVVAEPEPEVKQQPSAPNPASKPTSYNLGWGKYEGPMSGGVPHGLDGEVTVTRTYTIDLKKGGETRTVNPGDTITGCKFKDGKLVSGYIHYKNGGGEKITIGA